MKLNMIVVMTTWLPRQACSTAGTAAQAAPNSIAAASTIGGSTVQRRQVVAERQRRQRGADAAQHRLAFAADVEQPRMKCHRDRQAGEDEGRRVVQRVAQADAAAEGALDQQRQRLPRVLADEQHDEAGDEQRERKVEAAGRQGRASAAVGRTSSPGTPRDALQCDRTGSGPALSRSRRPRPRRLAHHAAERGFVALRDRRSPTMRPPAITSTRSASARISSSSDDTTSTASPASRIARRRPWMNSIAPMSTPRVGWPTSSTRGWARPRARARASAGCRRRTWRCAGAARRAHVVSLHHLRGVGAHRRMAASSRAAVARAALVAEHGRFPGREGQHQAAPVAVFGHMGEASPRARFGVEPMRGVNDCVLQPQRAGLRRQQARQHVEQLALAVARDAGDADDLAATQLSDTSARRGTPSASRQHRFCASSSGAPGLPRARHRPRAPICTRRPTIACASASTLVSAIAQSSTTAPRAHHRHGVADRHDLLELVGDQQHRRAARAQGAQRVEQLLGLLRREHRGRLVEDQDARAAVERLQDLQPLALAHRQLARPAGPAAPQAGVAHQRLQLARAPARARSAAASAARRRAGCCRAR